MTTIIYSIRPLSLPADYEALAEILNQDRSEPITAARLEADDAELYEKGHTWFDENGMLAGYDRERRVAVLDNGDIVGHSTSWRAPWTEPGYVCNILVVDRQYRQGGIGEALLRHAFEWAQGLGASGMLGEVWDDEPASLRFALAHGFAVERHMFQSLRPLTNSTIGEPLESPEQLLSASGLRLLTLADEPGEQSERKLYELSAETMQEIPGFLGSVPDFAEWRKWYFIQHGFDPELVLIAADGDRFIGMTNVLHNSQSNGLYHEYTGVARLYRGKGVAKALKLKAIELGIKRSAAYIRTDNDSLNAPILHINKMLGYTPLRGQYRLVATVDAVGRTMSGREADRGQAENAPPQ